MIVRYALLLIYLSGPPEIYGFSDREQCEAYQPKLTKFSWSRGMPVSVCTEWGINNPWGNDNGWDPSRQ